jgi:hypothetical protein
MDWIANHETLGGYERQRPWTSSRVLKNPLVWR